jgi:hypothetical protein
MPADKQLRGIRLTFVLEKRRLDQALNAKEFAVCAGVSYSTARNWFRLPGFPAFRGVVFWQDFVQWRSNQNQFADQPGNPSPRNGVQTNVPSALPPRAAKILQRFRSI